MSEKLFDDDRMRLFSSAIKAHHFQFAEFGKNVSQSGRKVELAAFNQDNTHQRNDRFRHRINAIDRILWILPIQIGSGHAAFIKKITIFFDLPFNTGKLIVINIALCDRFQ